jgi:hypothetical protein
MEIFKSTYGIWRYSNRHMDYGDIQILIRERAMGNGYKGDNRNRDVEMGSHQYDDIRYQCIVKGISD